MSARSTSALFLLAATAGAALLYAQSAKTITVRVFDGHSGDRVLPSNVIVRINRQSSNHVEWVQLADDGTATLTLPPDALSFSVRATYESSTEYYVNCDVSRQRDLTRDTWFPVADVLSEGVVMPNECEKPKKAQGLKLEAKPGEFILLVRKRNWRDSASGIR